MVSLPLETTTLTGFPADLALGGTSDAEFFRANGREIAGNGCFGSECRGGEKADE